jgi:hypothetical protein
VTAPEGPSLNGHHQIDSGHWSADGLTLVTRPRLWLPWLGRGDRQPADRARRWLRAATIALGLLAAAAAVVSWAAQYRLVYAYKHHAGIAAVQASIPDAGALVFAAPGIALALRGRQAASARILNVACVGISIAMNALASSVGVTAMAIWVMPAVLYALASDTLISVIRAIEAGDDTSSLAVVGKVALWSLRLVVAPRSTTVGARQMVLAATPLPVAEMSPVGETVSASPDPVLEPRSFAVGALVAGTVEAGSDEGAAQAAAAFASELAAGKVPSIRRIRDHLGCGQARAAAVQQVLRAGVTR